MRIFASALLPRRSETGAARRPGARGRALRLLLAGAALAALAGGRAAAADQWDPIDPADLAATDSKISPGADLEFLFRREELVQDRNGTVGEHYFRVKIYTPRGVEKAGLLSIDHLDIAGVQHLVARVVKVDGSVHELKKSDFFESTLAKVGQAKSKKTTFAFPNLAPGDLVEYRWMERSQYVATSIWGYCQWEEPVREYRFQLEAGYNRISLSTFNCDQVNRTTPDNATCVLTIRNIRPFLAEDHMIAERDWRGWLRLVYVEDKDTEEERWTKHFTQVYEADAADLKPNAALRRKAAELIAGAPTDEEKLRRLYNYCQKEIVNLSWEDTPEARKARLEEGPSGTDTARKAFSLHRGFAYEITNLFGGLARAAGFDAREAFNAPNTDLLRVRRVPHGWEFMRHYAIAVQLGGKWAYFAPGEAFVPFGMRHPVDEGTLAVIVDPKKPVYEVVPNSPAARTLTTRKGRFALDDAGQLAGDVEETRTGHAAIRRRIRAADDGAEKLDSDLKEEVGKRLPGAEITDIRWENLRDNSLPLVVHYRVKVPGYAEQLGERLVVKPGYFEAGAAPVFTADKRTYPIAFPYAWTEKDDIEITVPENLAPEAATAPADVRVRSDLQTAAYDVRFDNRRHTLIYKRDYSFGGGGAVVFEPESYDLLKFLFERLRVSDTHTIVFSPKTAEAAPAGAQPSGT